MSIIRIIENPIIIYNLRWFLIADDDFCWFLNADDGFHWFLIADDDSRWFLISDNDSRWFLLSLFLEYIHENTKKYPQIKILPMANSIRGPDPIAACNIINDIIRLFLMCYNVYVAPLPLYLLIFITASVPIGSVAVPFRLFMVHNIFLQIYKRFLYDDIFPSHKITN